MLFLYRNAGMLYRLSSIVNYDSGETSTLIGGKNVIIQMAYELCNTKAMISIMPSTVDESLFKASMVYFVEDIRLVVIDLYPELKPPVRKLFRELFVKTLRTEQTKKVFDSVFEDVVGEEHKCVVSNVDVSDIDSLRHTELLEPCAIPKYFNTRRLTFADACRICCGKTFKEIVDNDKFFLPSIMPLFLGYKPNNEHEPPLLDLLKHVNEPVNSIPYMLAYYARESLFDKATANAMYDLAEAIAFRYIGSLPRRCIEVLQGKTKNASFLLTLYDYIASTPTTSTNAEQRSSMICV